MTQESELNEAIRHVYEKNINKGSISPSWMATQAMNEIGFPRELHEIGYSGCHLQFRQIARSFCRKHFEPEETVENDLFGDTLQERYPLRQTEDMQEPAYVLLDLLPRQDLLYNVERLRKEARAKLRHADALEAWLLRKFGRTAA